MQQEKTQQDNPNKINRRFIIRSNEVRKQWYNTLKLLKVRKKKLSNKNLMYSKTLSKMSMT